MCAVNTTANKSSFFSFGCRLTNKGGCALWLMNQPQRVYQRILRLPCGDVREGTGFKDMLDAALKQVTDAICKSADGFNVKLGQDLNGQLQATITRGAHKIELRGRYGQNTVFKDGA